VVLYALKLTLSPSMMSEESGHL